MYLLPQFNPEQARRDVVTFIRNWFAVNGPDCNAVIGISGGKDSSVVAALCVEALGKERVIGVLMPNGIQVDIADSASVCEHLGIRNITINIAEAYNSLINQCKEGLFVPEADGYIPTNVTRQTEMNMPPRLRMTALYGVAQSNNGRVINTSNLSEWAIGWETRWGDSVGDIQPILHLTASEVIAIGLTTDLPKHLVQKTPADGLCGSTDEEAFGFSYDELDAAIRSNQWGPHGERICELMAKSKFKRLPIATLYNGSKF